MVKRLSTKELFAESIIELAEHQSLDKITITALSKNCGLSPRTFYDNFTDKYDLLNWIYLQKFDKAYGRLGIELTWSELIMELIEVMIERSEFYKNVITHVENDMLFLHEADRHGYTLLMDYIMKKNPVDSNPTELAFHVKMYLHAISSMAVKWFMDGCNPELAILAQYMTSAMPDTLKPYLLD